MIKKQPYFSVELHTAEYHTILDGWEAWFSFVVYLINDINLLPEINIKLSLVYISPLLFLPVRPVSNWMPIGKK